MRKVGRSLQLLATEHLTTQNVRVALVLLTLVSLVIAAGAPSGFGSGNGG
jgi:hypothetical protein